MNDSQIESSMEWLKRGNWMTFWNSTHCLIWIKGWDGFFPSKIWWTSYQTWRHIVSWMLKRSSIVLKEIVSSVESGQRRARQDTCEIATWSYLFGFNPASCCQYPIWNILTPHIGLAEPTREKPIIWCRVGDIKPIRYRHLYRIGLGVGVRVWYYKPLK